MRKDTPKLISVKCIRTYEKKDNSYEPYLKELARKLRNHSTRSEIHLWMHLKGRQMQSYDFHRQKPLDRFIANFFCHELMLVIELDGHYHTFEDIKVKDQQKQYILKHGTHCTEISKP